MSKIENHKESANTKASQQNKPRRVRRERRALDFGHSPQAPPPLPHLLNSPQLGKGQSPCPTRRRQHTPETFYFLTLGYQFFIPFNFFTLTNFYSNLFFYFYIFWYTFLIFILFWKFGACSFPISDWLKTPILLYFEKKRYMINHNAQNSSDFLKYTIWLINHEVTEFN